MSNLNSSKQTEFDYLDSIRSRHGPIAVYRRDPKFLRRAVIGWLTIIAGVTFVMYFLVGPPQSVDLWIGLGLCIWVAGILCFVFVRAGHKRIEVDFVSEHIRLFGYRYPLSFWDVWSKKFVEIPFHEIIFVERPYQGHSSVGSVDVYTKQSRFCFLESTERHTELEMVLDGICSLNPELYRRKRKRNVWISKAVVRWIVPAVVVTGVLVLSYILLP